MSISTRTSIEDLEKIKIIQGGMGLGVSGWRLAKKVSSYIPTGYDSSPCLGLISATAPDVLLTRGLQNGDKNGELREALSHFPNQEIAKKIYDKFFIEGGKSSEKPYRLNPFPTFEKTGDLEFTLASTDLEDVLVTGAFTEVYLAKKGHTNPIGANFLNKIGFAQLPTLYGAMLAGLDVACIGAGFPRNIPEAISAFVSGETARMALPVSGKPYSIVFDPKRFGKPQLPKPIFLAIIGNHLGLRGVSNADGYVFEGELAGGHNFPPRSKSLNDIGEPLFGEEDKINFGIVNSTLSRRVTVPPFWLGGNYSTRLQEALSQGAAGVQVGTPFALCNDSNALPELKQQAIEEIFRGTKVYTSARASPTGFPFKELPVPGTICTQEVYEARERVCNLGFLVSIHEDSNGKLYTRCPAEPVNAFVRKGGSLEETVGRQCLCNGLCSTIGLGMPGEKPIVTLGANVDAVKDLVNKHGTEYSAENVIDYVLGHN
jgi:nitronate monooxygenase